jgi:hypothetical protein
LHGCALPHRQVALKHNIGVWYASLYQASAASATLLYVTNTTNGGSSSSSRGAAIGIGMGGRQQQTRRVTVTDAASGATKTVRASPFAAGAHGATLRAEARAVAASAAAAAAAAAEGEEEDGGDDDDGYHHTHSSLVGFDLASGEIVEGPMVLGADGKTPVSWMNALDSAV